MFHFLLRGGERGLHLFYPRGKEREMRAFWVQPLGKEKRGEESCGGAWRLEAALRVWRGARAFSLRCVFAYKSQRPQLWVAFPSSLHPTVFFASWERARQPPALPRGTAVGAAGGCARPAGREGRRLCLPTSAFILSALSHRAEAGMAESELSQAAVLSFLQEHGGKVRNSALVSRFKPLLESPGGEPEDRAPLRERFKRLVNNVAVVKEQDGVKFVVLKKKHLRALAEEEPSPEPAGGCSCDTEEEEEEEEEEGTASLAPTCHASSGGAPFPPEQESGLEGSLAVPVSQLKSLFQKEGMEVPKAPRGQEKLAPKAALQKPCMLPVRCVLPSSGAKEPKVPTPGQQQPEVKDWLQEGSSAITPSTSPYTKRRQFDETGTSSPYPRRVPKSQKVGEEVDCAATAVPLEAAEHEWLVKATAGQWSQQLHGLLLSDKSLASKRDFMTGFTVLHWAAKSGNCDMLGKVIEVAEKGGAHVNVNSKSYGGYTPLHIAAIHGQEEVIAQLVRDYNANVNLRDYSGKKPFQYLKEGSSFAVRHLLRDPNLHTVSGHNASVKKNAKVAASILSSTSTVLGLLSDDTAFYELTKGLKKPASFNKFLNAATAPRRKLKSRGTFSSYSSLSEAVEEDQEEATTKRRPVSELFFGH
ncbi:ankyrin repeat domain-containing protein SOWAHA [Rhineura floridana]|uniref:ankyrin repeat domain-containing protein SOWAHA n=1 Tax=Rhineura floridana TaxID=261503 RepID=UPI002AC7E7D3|nr:ankyrin repeat domain-containing protein SOWAHA [Rhineura floridana]